MSQESIFKTGSGNTEVVKADAFDRDTFQQMKATATELQNTEKAGSETLKTFSPLLGDIFSSLYKYTPEVRDQSEVVASHKMNHSLITKAVATDQYSQLRTYTKMDSVNSALATITIANSLSETIKKDLAEEAKAANELEQAEQEAQEAQEQAKTLTNIAGAAKGAAKKKFKAQAKEATDKAAAAAGKVAQLTEKQEQALQGETAQRIRSAVRGAQDKAIEKIKETEEMMEGWGSEPGSVQLMPADKRLALAQKLSQNEKLKKLALLVGRFRRLAIGAQKSKVTHSQDEVYDLETGSDISRIVPSELALLHSPLTRLEFKRKFVEGKLLQYKLRGKEKVGRGAIVACVDNSGSMAGNKEEWSKAVVLALLEIARLQHRDFACIHFGAAKEPLDTTEILKNEKNVTEKVIHIASYFLDGGTDFQLPLDAAVEILNKSEFKKADIVMITDGDCQVNPEWLVKFQQVKKQKEFRVQSIEIMGSSSTLKLFSDNVTRLHELSGNEAVEIFEGI